jgi:hypothetical protein
MSEFQAEYVADDGTKVHVNTTENCCFLFASAFDKDGHFLGAIDNGGADQVRELAREVPAISEFLLRWLDNWQKTPIPGYL